MEPEQSQPSPSDLRYARLLDLRFVIAVMFAIFGVLVTFSGFTASNEEIDQAAGINISLWTGVGLLLLSGGFTAWLVKAPPEVAHSGGDDNDEDTEQPRT